MEKKGNIRRYIYSFWERELEDVRGREMREDFLGTDAIVDISGLRRSGKTYFIYFIIKTLREKINKKQLIYLNCEHRSFYPITFRELEAVIELIYQEELLTYGRVYIFLDEIQAVEGWEIFAKSVYDEFGRRVKLVVTGSVKDLISEEYGKLITGRHHSYSFFPLSFKEFLTFKGLEFKPTDEIISRVKGELMKYLHGGGLPEFVLSNSPDYIADTLNDIVARDIKSKVEIRKKSAVDELLYLLIERVGSTFTYSRLANLLKNSGFSLSTEIVIHYTDVMKDSFLFTFLPSYAFKQSEISRKPKKVYTTDNGFLSLYPSIFSSNIGKLMENVVAVELQRRGWDPGKTLFYFYGGDFEVDFLLKKEREVVRLMQVSYISSKNDIEQREVKALIRAGKKFHCSDLQVITWDYDAIEKINDKDIRFIPLWKWLLGYPF